MTKVSDFIFIAAYGFIIGINAVNGFYFLTEREDAFTGLILLGVALFLTLVTLWLCWIKHNNSIYYTALSKVQAYSSGVQLSPGFWDEVDKELAESGKVFPWSKV